MTTNDLWRQECGQALKAAARKGGGAGREHWADLRQQWLTAERPRVELEQLDLSKKTLRGYDLSHCLIENSKFVAANLSHVDFSQSILRGCDLHRADIRGASFFGADLTDRPPFPPNRLTEARFDRTTDMEVNRGMLASNIDQALIDMANTAWRRTEWLHRRSTSPLYRVLALTTDYGFGIGRLFLTALAVVSVFGGLFYWSDRQGTICGAFLDSTRYFMALGDPYEGHPILSAVGMVEAGLGFVALAMLVAIFTSKFTDL